MEMVTGRFMLKKVENFDAMAKALDMTGEVLTQMVGPIGVILDLKVEGDRYSCQRTDGVLVTKIIIGKQFDLPIGGVVVKVIVKVDGNFLNIFWKFPDGKLLERRCYFDEMGMTMEMSTGDVVMKGIFQRV